MEIIANYITLKSLKEQKNMSATSKIQGWEKSYSKFRAALLDVETADLEILVDLYRMMCPRREMEIKAVLDELELRNTSLGRELY
jgi:hypothetical protein